MGFEHQDCQTFVIRKPQQKQKQQHYQREPEKTSLISKHLANKIVAARIKMGWTRADLAMAIKEQTSVVTRYETCQEIPKVHILQKMRKALNCSLPSA